MIAYSAQNQQEISATGDRLEHFLNQINQGKSGSTLLWQLEQIFKKYTDHYDSKQQMLRLTSKTIKEIIFDENISQDKRQHLTDIQQKTKAQIDALHQQKSETTKIHQALTETVETLCKALGIALSRHPNATQLQGIRKKQAQANALETITFDALLQGQLATLSDQATLDNLAGTVVKKTAIGLSISLEADPAMEIIIMQQQLKAKTGGTDATALQTGMPVRVQIINGKKCTVTIDI